MIKIRARQRGHGTKGTTPIRTETARQRVEREVLRRIRNRRYDNYAICSMRRGGPGLFEMAGLIPLMEVLPAPEVRRLVEQELIPAIQHVNECLPCSGKVYALAHIIMKARFPREADGYLRHTFRNEAELPPVDGRSRDLVDEMRAAALEDPLRTRMLALIHEYRIEAAEMAGTEPCP